MIRWFLHRMINRVEKKLGVSTDESRYLLDKSMSSFLAFSTVQTWVDRHPHVPNGVYYAAKIAAYREEDCGTCLQIAVNLARAAGVPSDLVRAAANGRVEALPAHMQEAYRFGGMQANREDDDELRERFRARYGDEGLIELGMGIASARMFPAFKRTLGFAKSCAMVKVA